MYDGLSISPVDIYPVTIPVLQSPPSQSIPLMQQHREFKGERVETVISSYISSLYLRLINWNNVYLVRFPASLLTVPSIIFSSNNRNGICLNMDLATAKLDLKTNNISISDYTAFSACVVYGINKILFNNMKDEQVLSDTFNAMCGFLYSLIIRCYIKDIDISTISDQDIANMYYLVCKLVASSYVRVSGNLNALVTVATQRFFIKEDEKTKKKVPTARFNIDNLPKEQEVYDFTSLFSILDQMDIFPNITLSDFRTKVSKMFSSTLLSSLGNGLNFASMLASCKLPSEIFSQRILSVRPASVVIVSKSLNKYVLELTNNTLPIQTNNDLPPGW